MENWESTREYVKDKINESETNRREILETVRHKLKTGYQPRTYMVKR
jgi:hypothetical protein